MDLCGVFVGVTFVAAFIALIGHGIWVLAAAVLRFFFGAADARPSRERRPRVICVGCNQAFSWDHERCPHCALLVRGKTARELKALESMASEIQVLVEEGGLELDLAEKVYQSIENRQAFLLNRTAARLTPEQPAEESWERLERLLQGHPKPEAMPSWRRRLILAAFDHDRREDLKFLGPASLLTLARVLRHEGQFLRALGIFDLLLQTYPEWSETPTAAYEGGVLAAAHKKTNWASRFLQTALRAGAAPVELGAAERAEAQALLDGLNATTGAAREVAPTKDVTRVEATGKEVGAEPPAEPRRSFGEMLAGFMEARNILWGELVGGMLIVGCSIALVISLWEKLESIPYFPFLVFAAVTYSLFGAGVYTLRHWKLEATSRGLVVIATLLTPLNFLVLGKLAQRPDMLGWLVELTAVAAFIFLVQRSSALLGGHELMPRGNALATFAILGASITQLFVPRWLDQAEPQTSPMLFVLLSLAPVVCAGIWQGAFYRRLARFETISLAQAQRFYVFLGEALFAAVVALAFVVYVSDTPMETFQHLAVPLALAACPIVVGATLVSQKLERAPSQPTTTGLSAEVTLLLAGILAMSGAAVMLLCFILAWPRPVGLLVIAGLNVAVFSSLAFGQRRAAFHVPALASLALFMLVGFHLWHSRLGMEVTGPVLLRALTSLASAAPLVVMGLLLVGSAELLVRRRREVDGQYHIVAAGFAGLAALALAARTGTTAPGPAAAAFAVVGIGTLLANLRWRRVWLAWAGSLVLLGCATYTPFHLWPDLGYILLVMTALLLHAAILGCGGLLLQWYWNAAEKSDGAASELTTTFAEPLQQSAQWTSFLAVIWQISLTGFLGWDDVGALAWCDAGLAAFWLLLAWHDESPLMFTAAQGALMLAAILGVTHWLYAHELVGNDWHALVRLDSLQYYGMALASLSLFWVAIRLLLQRFASRRLKSAVGFAQSTWLTLDQWTLGFVAVTQLLASALAVLPEAFRETLPAGDQVRLERVFRDWPTMALPEAWLLTGILAVTLVGTLHEKKTRLGVFGVLSLTLTVPVLVALDAKEQLAAASALRWSLAVAFLICSITLWTRNHWASPLVKRGLVTPGDSLLVNGSRLVLVIGMVTPMLLLTVLLALVAFAGEKPFGPGADSVFTAMGRVPAVLAPLAIVIVGLVGHGVREDRPAFLLGAGLVFVATATGGYALGVVTSGTIFGAGEGMLLVQLGALSASAWTLGWLATRHWRHAALQLCLAGVAGAFELFGLAIALVAVLTFHGAPVGALLEQAGAWSGWLALAGTAAAGVWVGLRARRSERQNGVVHVLGVAGLGVGVLAASLTARVDATGWATYHVLTLSWTAVALAILVGAWLGTREHETIWTEVFGEWLPARPARRWVEGVGTLVVILSLAGAWGDPERPYWSCAAVASVALLLGALALWTRRPRYVYGSGALLHVVAYLVWQAWLVEQGGAPRWFAAGPAIFDRFLLYQIFALAGGSALWGVIEGYLRRRPTLVDLRGSAVPYVYLAAALGVQILAVLTLVGLANHFAPLEIHVTGPLVWIAWAALVGCVIVNARDPEANLWGFPAPPLHLLGLLAIGMTLHQTLDRGQDVAWWGCLALAAYVLLTAAWARWAPRPWQFVRPVPGAEHHAQAQVGWLLGIQTLLAMTVLGLGVWMVLTLPTLAERLPAFLCVAALAAALHLMTELPRLELPGEKARIIRASLAYSELGLGVVGVVLLGWAFLDPEMVVPWLQRSAVVLLALGGVGVVYRQILTRYLTTEDWLHRVRRVGRALIFIAVGWLVFFLLHEFLLYDKVERTTRLAWPLAGLVVLGLLGSMTAALTLALVPRLDAMGLSERRRLQFVWLAELLLLLSLVHLRLNVPDLFPGFIGKNWPLVVMAIGYLGTGLAELCRRRGIHVLAQPLYQTGMILPLVPLLAFLVRPLGEMTFLEEAVPGLSPFLNYLRTLPSGFALHAVLWFLLGGLYALVAVARRTTTFGLLAALAATFGVWVILANVEDLNFFDHPQLWLIPIGLIVLAGEFLQRDRLGQNVSVGARYLGLTLIYVSSTADMFITGVGNSVLLPIVLALLSVAGVLVGILLRVRAFLFLGVNFLLLVIFAEIWHAAVDRQQTWLWWASGILLGVAILTLFALFEKRRNNVVQVIEEIKRWE